MPIIPPYHFVPIPQKNDGTVDCITDTPVFHDGSQIKAQELLSGEIRCTMTALTPLLVGNDRYEISTAKGAGLPDSDGLVSAPHGWGIPIKVKNNKSVLEPMRLPDDGRVIIGGDSIKGMLRHSIGALLGAPMERVAERTYGYKPNAYASAYTEKYPRPAVITQTSPMEIVVLPVSSEIFIDQIQFDRLTLIHGNKIPGDIIHTDPPKRYFRYVGGIDGTGDLTRAYHANLVSDNLNQRVTRNQSIYKHVTVLETTWQNAVNTRLPVLDSVIQHYNKTTAHLSNLTDGHVCSRHPLNNDKLFKNIRKSIKNIAKSILKNSELTEYQLIYVELEQIDGNITVTSLGHHFYYQWRYFDTVRTKWNRTTNAWETRSILSPAPCEKPREGGAKPEKLSGARLFFGYTVDKTSKNQEIALGVAKGDFEKLAGRIACNIAVEDTTNPQDRTRFINHEQRCVVPLKPLGMPRPSAVEYYLQQNLIGTRTNDGGILITYGDLLNDDPTGELNGRKFYLHQPDAAIESNYHNTFMTNDNRVVGSNQASFARFILEPNAKFKFTLRFRDLRPWELGILLTVLEMRQDVLKTMFPEIENRILQEQTNSEIPCYAHKLGYGRPLGLGSVVIKADQFLFFKKGMLLNGQDNSLKEVHHQERQRYLCCAKIKLEAISNNTVLQWLKVHQYQGRNNSAYPTLQNQNEIFKYHSNIRLAHARSRREGYSREPKNIYADALQPLPD